MAGPSRTNPPKHAPKPNKPVTIDASADDVKASVAAKTTPEAEAVGFSAEKPAKDAATSSGDAKSGLGSTPKIAPKSATPPSSNPSGSKTPPPPARSSGSSGGFIKGGIAGAVTGGLVALGLSYGGMIGGTSDTTEMSTNSDAAISDLQSQIAALQEQMNVMPAPAQDGAAPTIDLSGIESAVAGLQSQSEALNTRIDAISGDLAALSSTDGSDAEPNPMLSTLSDRIAALETAPQTAVETDNSAQEAAITELETKIEAFQAQSDDDLEALRAELASAQAALAETSSNLAATQSRVDEVAGEISSAGQDQGLASIVAATALKSAIDRGGAFTAELETFALMGAAPQSIEALRGYAGSGVATIEQLSVLYEDAAYDMVAAANPAPASEGMFGQLMSSAQSLVKVRPVGEVEGDGPDAAIARMGVALERNDLETVLSEYDTLPENVQAAGAVFAAKTRARLEANQLITDAFAAIAPATEGAQ